MYICNNSQSEFVVSKVKKKKKKEKEKTKKEKKRKEKEIPFGCLSVVYSDNITGSPLILDTHLHNVGMTDNVGGNL